MTVVPLIALLLAAPGGKGKVTSEAPKPLEQATKLEQGVRAFNLGDFEAALKALDAAAAEGGDAATLEKVHLLRAQCFAARQDYARAEEAFALALDANPDATLDPTRVDPTVVKVLDSVRARLTGTLVAGSTPAGATLLVDGKSAGVAPLTMALPVGKHHVEAKWGDGELKGIDVQVRPKREVRVEWVQGPGTVKVVKDVPDPKATRPFGDLRLGLEIPSVPSGISVPVEVGGGIEFFYFRVSLWARVYPNFGLVPRFAFALPVVDRISVMIEVGAPLIFIRDGLGVGLNGQGGVEFAPARWVGFFALIGGRHYFTWPGRNDPTALTASIGANLKLP